MVIKSRNVKITYEDNAESKSNVNTGERKMCKRKRENM